MDATLNIPLEAKAWIYQSPAPFNTSQIDIIENELTNFIASWESHGVALKGSFEIIANQFILLAVDERTKDATGCSIDKSVSIIKKLETLLNLNLTDRSLVAYELNNQVKTIDFRNIKTLIESGEINPNTPIFNLSITNYGEFLSSWKIKAIDSWIKRYFN